MAWGRLIHVFDWLRHRDPPREGQAALRDQMTHEDPDFAHVRDVQHDALNVLAGDHAAQQIADGISLRRETDFWRRHGHHQEPS